MFEPGHVHRESLPNDVLGKPYCIDFYYEVRQDPQEGEMLHGHLVGEIAGKPFEDEFDLHRDMACNFASVISRRLAKHGLPVRFGPVMGERQEYEALFCDIRDKLNIKPGDRVNLDHLLR